VSRGRRSRCGGAAVLYAVVLSPLLMLGLALAVQLGALQLERQRVRSAVDEAAVTAASAASVAGAAAGVDHARAAALLREALATALRPLEGDLGGAGADAVAAGAEVAVLDDVPVRDPFATGVVVRRPAIEARVRIPLRSGLLRIAALPSTLILTVVTGADLRRADEAAR
jgi:Flp pilus assembly protein TadG